MSQETELCRSFFELLRSEQTQISKGQISYIQQAIYNFIENGNKENAFFVYSIFFDVYRIKTNDEVPFVDMLDLMRAYEEKAASFNEKQRDHYVHSVSVFILGLSLFGSSTRLQDAFAAQYNCESSLKMAFDNTSEEFFFRWGMAALLHDIGYPVEIIFNQLRSYFTLFTGDREAMKTINPHVAYMDCDCLNSLDTGFLSAVELKRNGLSLEDCSKATRLLGWKISRQLGTDLQMTVAAVDSYIATMQKSEFVDHAFYSALILLKWYCNFARNSANATQLLLYPVLNIAAAILLHNYYRGSLLKEPFKLAPLPLRKDPLSFLLMLCDELQEWNRQAYGSADRLAVPVDKMTLSVEREELKVHYITKRGVVKESFIGNKKALFAVLLQITDVFPRGITITATTLTDLYIEDIREKQLLPRPMIASIESIAQKIHENYNDRELERHPEKPLEYPTWDGLPDTLKYSNVRQAQTYQEKLSLIGCYYGSSPLSEQDSMVTAFTKEEIELLAEYEHILWCEERKQNGWTYGDTKDVSRKITPFLIPYEELTEEDKQKDRDTVVIMLPIIEETGMHVYRKNEA